MRPRWPTLLIAGSLACAAGAGPPTQPPPLMPCASDAAVSTAPAAPPLPLKEVVIDAGGMGTFLHVGKADKDTEWVLPFHSADYADAVRTIHGDPLLEMIVSTPDPIFGLARGNAVAAPHSYALGDLLDQLRGQTVEVSPDGKTIYKGPILSVDAGGTGGGAGTTAGTAGGADKGKSYTLNVSTDAGVVAVALAPSVLVKLSDLRAAKELQDALTELARGNTLADRPIRFKSPAGVERGVTYSHPLPPWQLRYTLNTGAVGAPTATASAVVRNTTALEWNDVTLRLTDSRWPGKESASPDPFPFQVKQIPHVTLPANDSAAFPFAAPPVDVKPSLTYQLGAVAAGQPPTPVVEKVSVSGSSAAFPVTLLEDEMEIGHADLSSDAAGAGAIKINYPLLTVRASYKDSYSPVSLAHGILMFAVSRGVSLKASNAAKGDKEITLLPETSWTVGGTGKNVVTIKAGATDAPVALTESAARSEKCLLGLGAADLDTILKSLNASACGEAECGVSAVLTRIKQRRQEAEKNAAALDLQRQALADAINAVASRQPPVLSSLPTLTTDQMLQDEATVAALRLRMEANAAAKAREFYEADEYIRLQTVGVPADVAP